MTRPAMFALMLVGIAFGLITIVSIESKPVNNGLPLVHADYRSCTTIHNGPIRRPDAYSARPHGRKADVA